MLRGCCQSSKPTRRIVPALDALLATLQETRDSLAAGRSIAGHLARAREWRERLVAAAG